MSLIALGSYTKQQQQQITFTAGSTPSVNQNFSTKIAFFFFKRKLFFSLESLKVSNSEKTRSWFAHKGLVVIKICFFSSKIKVLLKNSIDWLSCSRDKIPEV